MSSQSELQPTPSSHSTGEEKPSDRSYRSIVIGSNTLENSAAPALALPSASPRTTRIVRRGPGFAGVIGAVLFVCLAQTTSLQPRSWIPQGVVAGIAAACGDGLGASIGAIARAIGPSSWSTRPSRRVTVDGWVALGAPATWTTTDTQALRAVIDGST